jgi:hypothetical protein
VRISKLSQRTWWLLLTPKYKNNNRFSIHLHFYYNFVHY